MCTEAIKPVFEGDKTSRLWNERIIISFQCTFCKSYITGEARAGFLRAGVVNLFFLFSFFLSSSFFLVLLSCLFLLFLYFAFLCLSFSFCFVFLLFSFPSFIFFSFLRFFSPIDLRLSCVCVVIDTTCNRYARSSLPWVAIGIFGFSRREQ